MSNAWNIGSGITVIDAGTQLSKRERDKRIIEMAARTAAEAKAVSTPKQINIPALGMMTDAVDLSEVIGEVLKGDKK